MQKVLSIHVCESAVHISLELFKVEFIFVVFKVLRGNV